MRIRKVSQTTPISGEIVDSLDGNSVDKAPSVHIVNEVLQSENVRLRTDIDGIGLVGTANGTSIDLTDSAEARFSHKSSDGLEIEGNSFQETTSAGKNYLQIPSSLARTVNGLTFVVNNDGSVTITGTATARTVVNVTIPEIPAGQYIFSLKTVGTISTGGQQMWSLRDSNNDLGLNPTVGSDSTRSVSNTISSIGNNLDIATNKGIELDCTIYPQIEKGTTVTEWEQYTGTQESPSPDHLQEINSVGDNGSATTVIDNTLETTDTDYQSQTHIIPCQQPMRSIGNVRDKFVRVDGNWIEKHYIGETVFDGSDDENWSYEFLGGTRNNFYIAMQATKQGTNYAILNNMGRYTGTLSNNYNCYISPGGLLNFRYDKYNNVTDFKNFLSTKSMKLIYQLETPTDLPCTAEQTAILEQIYNQAKTYEGGTHIYSTDEISPYFKVEYFKNNIENTANKVTSISADSTNTEYPSAKAVYDYGLDIYSTEEVKTNKIWIDGKPIYRKIVNFTISNSLKTWNAITTISSFDTIITCVGKWAESGGTGTIKDLPWSEVGAGNGLYFYYNKNNNVISEIHNNSQINDATAFIIVEYTKTTDTTNATL